MKAIIFAAGLGTRLKPLTDTRPKALVEIGGITLLERQIRRLKAVGITDIVVNVHHFAQQVIDYIDQHQQFGINIHISDESEQLLDTGGGLKKAQPYLDGTEPILVHNVDIVTNLDLRQLIAAHQPDALATLVVSQRKTSRYLLFDQQQRMRGWQNIQTQQTRPEQLDTQGLQPLAFSGIQVISPQIFNYLESFGEKFSIIDLYVALCQKANIRAYVPSDYQMMDVGKIDQLSEAQSFVAQLEAHE